jgi:hypothetical protein
MAAAASFTAVHLHFPEEDEHNDHDAEEPGVLDEIGPRRYQGRRKSWSIRQRGEEDSARRQQPFLLNFGKIDPRSSEFLPGVTGGIRRADAWM